MPLFLCCHCENNCSSFGAVALFPTVPNLYQGSCCAVQVEVEERYFSWLGYEVGKGWLRCPCSHSWGLLFPQSRALASAFRLAVGSGVFGLLPARSKNSVLENIHQVTKCWSWLYPGVWCMGRAATWMYLCVMAQGDTAGEWRNTTMMTTHLVAPGARHSENVRENRVYSTVLFLSLFIVLINFKSILRIMLIPKPCVAILASSPADLRWGLSMSEGCGQQLDTHSQPPHFI